MVLTTEFNNKGKEGLVTARDAVPDHQAQMDEDGRRRRQRDIEDLAAESVGRENGRIKRFRPATEAALRAAQVREGVADSRMTTATALLAAQQAWDNQLVTVAGVTMTNAERQTARKRILENPEQTLQWLRQRNLLKAGEEQDFLRALRSEMEIDEIRRANGGQAPPELEDQSRRNRARFGRSMDGAMAQSRKDVGWTADATAERASSMVTSDDGFGEQESARSAYRYQVSEEEEPPTAPYEEEQTFPSAPVLARAWDAAQAATTPLDSRPEQAPAPADPVAAGSGLSF
ncbi:MAG TPA: hypothetical protein PKA33_19220 [Amaricoccus sp.]|uniref:hypothetical protein n=1 Tax=Amaricoccus sp. TaxID=1872485 RepID=UPI002C3B092E|nr:hypothetical protein [Amaricoccus sp.]HMU01471.1 hypothetical protein [Amaricoccus sp.]